MYTHATTRTRPATAQGPLLGFSLGPQVPCKSGQANNVYLSGNTTYTLAFSLTLVPVFAKGLGFHPGDLLEARLAPSCYAHPCSPPPHLCLLHLTKLTCFRVRKIMVSCLICFTPHSEDKGKAETRSTHFYYKSPLPVCMDRICRFFPDLLTWGSCMLMYGASGPARSSLTFRNVLSSSSWEANRSHTRGCGQVN